MRTLIGDQPKCFEEVRMFFKQSGGGMHLLQGKAGVGKSSLMDDVVNYLYQNHIKVVVTAPSHEAVNVVKGFVTAEVDFFTTHSAFGMKEVKIDNHGKRSFVRDLKTPCKAEKYQVVIIDEASMVADGMFDEAINLVQQFQIKILFVGDEMQIPPIGQIYSKPFQKEIQEKYHIGISTMNIVLRQAEGHPTLRFALNIRENINNPIQIIDPQRVESPVGDIIPIKEANSLQFFVDNILPLYKNVEYKEGANYIKTIAWHNKVVNFYNKIIREFLFGENLPKIIVGDLLIADAPIVEGNKILISTNQRMIVLATAVEEEALSELYVIRYYRTRVKVFNGEEYNEYMIKIVHEDSEATYNKLIELQTHVALSYPKGSFQARSSWIDKFKFEESWHQTKYAYAISAHKAQGSSYIHAFVLYWDIKTNPNIFERNRIFYTSATRPSKNLYIAY
jgi:exodeoxyribonuclease-5